MLSASNAQLWPFQAGRTCDTQSDPKLCRFSMSHHSTIRSLLSLLTAALVSVHTVGPTFTVRCDAGFPCCELNSNTTGSCCGSANQSCCSSTNGCSCRGIAESRCSTACSCGAHEPEPASPFESQTRDDVPQWLSHAIRGTGTVSYTHLTLPTICSV